MWKCIKCCFKTENGFLKTQTKHPLKFLFSFFFPFLFQIWGLNMILVWIFGWIALDLVIWVKNLKCNQNLKGLGYRDMRDTIHKAPSDKYVRLAITINFSSTIHFLARLRPPEPQSQRETIHKGHIGRRETQSSKEKKSVLILIFQICIFLFFFLLMLLFSSFFLLTLFFFFFCLQPFYMAVSIER